MSRNKPSNKGGLLVLTLSLLTALSFICSAVACQQALKLSIATDSASGYDKDLSKTKSGKPSRYLLAFFVPDTGAASQAVIMPSSTAPNAPKNASRGQYLISMAKHLPADYDGLTLQNKTAERRICGAVAFSTESKTRHPIPIIFNQPYSVATTQKLKGGYHA